MDIIPQRPCSKCGECFPYTGEYFTPCKNVKSGLRSECRACHKKFQADYYAANRARLLEQKRQHRIDNPEQYAAKDYRRYHDNRDTERERNRQYRQSNREGFLRGMREWRIRNHETVIISDRTRNKNPIRRARQTELTRRWRKNNPEQFHLQARAWSANRRARLLAAEGSHTKEDILLQYRSQRGKCWHCGKPVGDDYHVDHLRPLAKDGSNDPRNLVISCAPCNLSKGDKQTWEWNRRLL